MKSFRLLALSLACLFSFSVFAHYGQRYSQRRACGWHKRDWKFYFHRNYNHYNYTQMTDYTEDCIANWNNDAAKIRNFHHRISNNYKLLHRSPQRAMVEFRRLKMSIPKLDFKSWCISGGWVSIASQQHDRMVIDQTQLAPIVRCGELVANYHLKLADYNSLVTQEPPSAPKIAMATSNLRTSLEKITHSPDCLEDPNISLAIFMQELSEVSEL